MESRLYYPHHAHLASGSIGDSILRIPDYVKRAKEYGLKHLTMTDHGSLSAMYAFCDECQKQGIEPIVGMEAYECEDKSLKDKEHRDYNHLILLAKNWEGMQNLFQIHNHAAIEGFYYKPRTDKKDLEKYGRGLIGMSACIAGTIPQAILHDDLNKAISLVQQYKEFFDSFYLEIQPGRFKEQIIVNDGLVLLGQETNTPLIATNDIHYLNPEDYRVHDYHVKLGRSNDSKKEITDKLIYPDTCYWFMDRHAMRMNFIYTDIVTQDVVEKALDNTIVVAESCKTELSSEMHMPAYPTKDGKSEEETLYEMCFERLNKIIQNKPNPEVYVDRLLRELEVIKQKGFCGYFLVVQDYINWARDHGIPVGPGRGSAAGSLVSNVLGISQPDPIKYELMFERFLDPCRAAIPDIDVDFDCSKRDDMFLYAVKRYGYDHCALVSTLHIRKAKGAIRDAARVLGYEPAIGDEIAKLIPQVVYGDDGDKMTDLAIKEAISVVPKLQELEKKYGDIIDLAEKLEGLPSSSGIHAAGILISPIPLTDRAPLIKPNKEGVLATSLNLDDAEKNFVKFDYLGLACISVLKNTENDVGWDFDYQNDTLLEDDAVWELVSSRNTTGVFQVSSKTYKDRMPRLNPHSIDELAACLALVRGPCISNKMDELYMQIVEGKQEPRKIHPIYDRVMAQTNGIMIFQEQIIKLIVAFGFDLPTGYTVMKWAQKKKVEKLKEFRPKFIEQASKNDCDEDTANKIFNMIVDAGLYSFNRAHATSYALITYVSAYLKVHYPLAFMKNLLTNTYERGEKELYESVLEDCRRLGIKFLPPDVNKSDWGFTMEDGCIRVGMCAIKGFGEKAAQQVIENRPFVSMEDLLDRVEKRSFNKKVTNVGIFAGLFDSLTKQERRETYEHFMELRDEEPEEELKISKGFCINTLGTISDFEEEILGGDYTADPANELESFGWQDVKPKAVFETFGYIKKVKKIKTKKGDQMAFVQMTTGDGMIECTVFPNTYKQILKKLLKKKQFCAFQARKENEESCVLIALEDGDAA